MIGPQPPARPARFVWWWAGRVLRPFVRRSDAVLVERLTVEAATARVVEQAFGPGRSVERRRDLLELLTYSAITLGAIVGIVGVLIGLAVDLMSGARVGHIAARAFGVVFTAPLMALGFVWAVRWAFARHDRPGEPMSRAAQPGSRDLLYAAPIALTLALFFALV